MPDVNLRYPPHAARLKVNPFVCVFRWAWLAYSPLKGLCLAEHLARIVLYMSKNRITWCCAFAVLPL